MARFHERLLPRAFTAYSSVGESGQLGMLHGWSNSASI